MEAGLPAMRARRSRDGTTASSCGRAGTSGENDRMDAWTRRVYAVVRSIPSGRVASYGLVALVAGRPRAARAVGNVMLECDDPTVPCHRVVHADGSLAPSFRSQRARLRR